MITHTTDPRVLEYEFEGFTIRTATNPCPGGFCVKRFDCNFISAGGERIDYYDPRVSYFTARTAALIALLRYEDSRRGEGEMRVVPVVGNWENPICLEVRTPEGTQWLHTNGKTSDGHTGGFGEFRWYTPAAALLALIEWREKQANQPPILAPWNQPAPPARRWEVEDGFVKDGQGNYLEVDGETEQLVITQTPRCFYQSKALAVADYANTHGPHPPEPEVWECHYSDNRSTVSKDGVDLVTFFRKQDVDGWNHKERATAYMQAQRDGGRGDE